MHIQWREESWDTVDLILWYHMLGNYKLSSFLSFLCCTLGLAVCPYLILKMSLDCFACPLPEVEFNFLQFVGNTLMLFWDLLFSGQSLKQSTHTTGLAVDDLHAFGIPIYILRILFVGQVQACVNISRISPMMGVLLHNL